MKYLPVIITGLLIFSGCLDFLEEEESNQTPTAAIKIEGSSPFEPDEEIVFTAKGSSDPDGDSLEYYWDFDSSDNYNDNKVGDISNNGRIIHSYSQEKTYTVTLTVSDGDKTGTITAKVKVEKPSRELRAIVTTDDDTGATMNGDERKDYTFSATDSINTTLDTIPTFSVKWVDSIPQQTIVKDQKRLRAWLYEKFDMDTIAINRIQ